jgi:hypothetical protein
MLRTSGVIAGIPAAVISLMGRRRVASVKNGAVAAPAGHRSDIRVHVSDSRRECQAVAQDA